MTQITPPFTISKVRPRTEFSKAQNNYLDLLERSLQQIYRRVGGQVDAVDVAQEDVIANDTATYYLLSQIKSLSERINALEVDTVVIPPQAERDHDADGSHIVSAQLDALRRRVDALEADMIAPNLNHIESRLKDLEKQI